MTLILHKTVTGEDVRPCARLDRRRRRLSTVVARQAHVGRPFIVSVHRVGETALAPTDDTVVLKNERSKVLVGPADIVVVTYLPLGGAGGGGGSSAGKQIGMALAAVALLVIAPYAAGAIAGVIGVTSAAGIAAIQAGIVLGGTALLSLANRPKANKQDKEDDRPVYGVSGGGNLPRPGDRIPRGYGRFWTVPDLSQPDFFTYEGEEQVLYKRMTLGLGRYQVHTIRVGQQVMWTEAGGYQAPFAGAELEIIQPGNVSSLVPGDVVSSQSVTGNELPRPGELLGEWSGPFVVSGPGVQVNAIQLDFSAPQGAFSVASNSKGSFEAAAALGWWFEYVEVDNAGNVIGTWRPLEAHQDAYFTKRPLRFTRIIPVPMNRYAVRGKNLFAGDSSNSRVSTIVNSITWDGLRGYRPDVRVRPKVTEIALKIRSNAALGITSFADVQVEATAIVPVWNGSSWSEQATRKAVWAYADIMRNATYGGAIPDSAFDATTALHYANTLSQFDTFDGVIRGPDSVWNSAAAVLFPMRSEPVQLGRLWSMVRDEPKAIRRHVITPRQMVRGSTGLSFNTNPDTGEGHVIVEYDEGADPKRPVEPPDIIYGSASLTPTRRKLFGVSSYEHAVHLGRWLAASGFYRRQSVRFSTEHDARIYKRGDSIALEAWFTGKAKVAGVIGLSGNTLTLDADVTVAVGDHVTLRDRSGREWGPVALASQGGSPREIVLGASDRALVEAQTGLALTSVLALESMETTTALVAPVTTLRRNYLIKGAKPSGRDQIDVDAVIDAPEVWSAIGATIAPNPYPTPAFATLPPPSALRITERIYADAGSIVSAVTLYWTRSPDQRALTNEVQFRVDGGPWQFAGSSTEDRLEIRDLPPGMYDFRVRAVYSAVNVSEWALLAGQSLLGVMSPPAAVDDFRISVLGDRANLTWLPVLAVNLSHYEIRYSPQLSGVTWGSSVPLIERVATTSAQVPAMVGTYLIKAVTLQGISSQSPSIITSGVVAFGSMNAVEQLIEQPAFDGVKVDVIRDPGRQTLQFEYVEDVFTRSDWFGVADFFLGTAGFADGGIYYFDQGVDLGQVYTSRLSAVIEAFGENVTDDFFTRADAFDAEDWFATIDPSTWNVTIEFRATDDDPSLTPAWSDWQPVVIGDYTARAYEFRALLASTEFGVTPVVERLEVTIDMPDRVISAEDLVVPTGGLAVGFTPPFRSLKGVAISAQGLNTGDYYSITAKSQSGFTIRFFNSAGTPIQRSFDHVSVGYGQEQ